MNSLDQSKEIKKDLNYKDNSDFPCEVFQRKIKGERPTPIERTLDHQQCLYCANPNCPLIERTYY